MYKALIFDLGKVVFDYSWEKTFDSWAKAVNADTKHIQNQFQFSETFAQFERGDVSPEDFCRHVSDSIGIELCFRDFEDGWNNIYLELFPGIDELLCSLKKNYRIAALTNTNALHARRFPELFSNTLSHFERVFMSHELRARKPEPAAYNAVLNYLGEKPSSTIMLDDLTANIKAAEQLGMKGILVSDFNAMCRELKSAGIGW